MDLRHLEQQVLQLGRQLLRAAGDDQVALGQVARAHSQGLTRLFHDDREDIAAIGRRIVEQLKQVEDRLAHRRVFVRQVQRIDQQRMCLERVVGSQRPVTQ